MGKFQKKAENQPKETPETPQAATPETPEVTPEAPEQPKAVKIASSKPPLEIRTVPEPVKHAVNSPSEALKLFKSKYALPAGNDLAYVCEDGNVFFKANESSALAHARDKKLKLFTVKP